MIGEWSEQDPQAAFDFLRTSSASLPARGYRDLFKQWGVTAPEIAWKHARELPPGESQIESIHGVSSSWAKRDPEKALHAASTLPSSGLRNVATSVALDEWSRADWRAVLDWSQHGEGEVERAARAVALRQCARESPREALDRLHLLKDDAVRDSVSHAAMQAWGTEDPDAAVAYVRSLPGTRRAEQMESALLAQWAARDPAKVAAEIQNLPAARRPQLAVTVAQHFSEHDLPNAIHWLEQIKSDPSVHGVALSAVMSRWAVADPRAASAYLLNAGDASARANHLPSVLAQWARIDAEAAARWTQKIVDAEARQQATRTVSLAWARQDPVAAAGYVLSLPQREADLEVLRRIALEWSLTDRDGALAWSAQLRGTERDAVLDAIK